MEINVAENLSVSEVKEVTFFEAPKPKEKKITQYDINDAFNRMKRLKETLSEVQNIVNCVKYEDTEESWRNAYDSIYSAFRWAYEEEKSIVAKAECTPIKCF